MITDLVMPEINSMEMILVKGASVGKGYILFSFLLTIYMGLLCLCFR